MRVIIAVAALLAGGAASAQAAVHLRPCPDVDGARCGSLVVPLDREGVVPGTVRVGFELYPRRDRKHSALGTIVAIEGGPGYATTSSRDYYLQLFAPLERRHQLLLVDLRGTGRSQPIDCPRLQGFYDDPYHPASIDSYLDAVGTCGRQLGSRAELYDTAASVDDIADVVSAVGVAPVDLYGDSYGSFAAQVFALRHASLLRSLVLDSTFPLAGGDAYARDANVALRRALRLTCSRSPTCPWRGTDPVARVRALADRLRRHPVVGIAPDADGALQHVRFDEEILIYVLTNADVNLSIARDLPAAAEALRRGDDRPLLRLAAENVALGDSGDPRDYSDGEDAAVICHDYPQLWDTRASLARRRVQFRHRLATVPRDAFSPFSVKAWLDSDVENLDTCLEWPAPARRDPPRPRNQPYPSVPTLILSSDIDQRTSHQDALLVARRFPRSTFVTIRNSSHAMALVDWDHCASTLVRRFVLRHTPGPTTCGSSVEEIRVVPSFPLTAQQATPAMPTGGDGSTAADRRDAAVAADVVGDALARYPNMAGSSGVGLRGGSFVSSGDYFAGGPITFQFDRTRFVRDVAVTGIGRWNRLTGEMTARLRLSGPGTATGVVTMQWNVRDLHAIAHLGGTLGGRRLHLRMPAP